MLVHLLIRAFLRSIFFFAGEIINCKNPRVFSKKYQDKSPIINTGALGNNYFVNALRLLSCKIDYVKRLLVSDKYASQGCYTFKFHKYGKWRYVHIDDAIPCRQSGAINYCHNYNNNEVFAMLLEKAYAKLHGCYEALSNGLVEKALIDLTYCAHIKTIRCEDLRKSRTMNADKVLEYMQQCKCHVTSLDHEIRGSTCAQYLFIHMQLY
jgi:hypothetical protein